MALLSENLHSYSLPGLYGMADLLVEIEARAKNYILPVKFLQELIYSRADIFPGTAAAPADSGGGPAFLPSAHSYDYGITRSQAISARKT